MKHSITTTTGPLTWAWTALAALCLIAAGLAASASAQEPIITYPNGNSVVDMELQGDYVWCSTTCNQLVRWNKSDGTYRLFAMLKATAGLSGYTDYSSRCIEKDAQGNLWIGTSRGLQRFDGTTFTLFDTTNSGLVFNSVQAIAPAGNSVIWIGTYRGLSKFDGKTWTNYTTQTSGILSDNVSSLAVDRNGVVWIGHSYSYVGKTGLSSFDGSVWKTYTSENSGFKGNKVNTIAVDSHNMKWFGADTDLYSFDGQTWATYGKNFTNGLNLVNDLTFDSKGVLWVAAGAIPNGTGYAVYSLSSFDGTSWTRYRLDEKLDFPIRGYSNIRIDTDGTIWFVTNDGDFGAHSLHSYDGSTVKTYRTDGPLSDVFNAIAVDSGNRKWFATGYGVSVFDGKTWKNHLFKFTLQDSPSANLDNANLFANNIDRIAVDRDNTVWITKGSLTASFDGTTWKYYHYGTDPSYSVLGRILLVDRNNIKWIAGNGLFRYDGKSWTSYKRLEINLNSGAVDNDNVKWLGTYGDDGVWSFDDTTWKHYTKDNCPLTTTYTLVAADRKNVKWFADRLDRYRPIFSFDGTSWKTYPRSVTGIDTTSQISNLYVDRNNTLWVSHRSLTSFDGKTWKSWPSIKNSQWSCVLAFDNENYMWLATQFSGVAEGSALSALKISVEPSGVAEALPAGFAITGNHPNPFNPSTAISFTLPGTGKAGLAVYSVTGQKIRELVSGTLPTGKHSVVWDGRDSSGRAVSSGVYFSHLTWNGRTTANRMLLMK